MCSANAQRFLPDVLTQPGGTVKTPGQPGYVGPNAVRPIAKPTDIPLGEGDIGAARMSILTRRQRIRDAVEGR